MLRLAVLACTLAFSSVSVLAAPVTTPAAGESKPDTPAIAPEAAPEATPAAATGPQYDLESLPGAVRETRAKIIAAAKTGDPEALRAVFAAQAEPPALIDADAVDPIQALASQSFDGTGHEMLALMIDVLEAGFVRADAGTDSEMYVWPYFARTPLDSLTPAQRVELFRVMTAYEYEEMRTFGAYNFFRLGISPDGTWHFFVTGD